ncbi:hypothetical protein D3C81_1944460 [compost metagenome]
MRLVGPLIRGTICLALGVITGIGGVIRDGGVVEITAQMIMNKVLAVAPENLGDGVSVHVCK